MIPCPCFKGRKQSFVLKNCRVLQIFALCVTAAPFFNQSSDGMLEMVRCRPMDDWLKRVVSSDGEAKNGAFGRMGCSVGWKPPVYWLSKWKNACVPNVVLCHLRHPFLPKY